MKDKISARIECITPPIHIHQLGRREGHACEVILAGPRITWGRVRVVKLLFL